MCAKTKKGQYGDSPREVTDFAHFDEEEELGNIDYVVLWTITVRKDNVVVGGDNDVPLRSEDAGVDGVANRWYRW